MVCGILRVSHHPKMPLSTHCLSRSVSNCIASRTQLRLLPIIFPEQNYIQVAK
jgi:hypothetical protein